MPTFQSIPPLHPIIQQRLLEPPNNDGVKIGFANEALEILSKTVNIPIIASGGAGNIQHFVDVFTNGKADAALAASVFHFGEININDLKQELQSNQINIRL